MFIAATVAWLAILQVDSGSYFIIYSDTQLAQLAGDNNNYQTHNM
jgi:hypothetical protein